MHARAFSARVFGQVQSGAPVISMLTYTYSCIGSRWGRATLPRAVALRVCV